MKRMLIGISLLLATVAGVGVVSSRSQDGSDPQSADNAGPLTHNWAGGNPLKIALLKWYQANLTTSFPTPEDPWGVVFDGENIWMCTNATGPDKVVKLRASDGANLGTFDVGFGAMGMAFDGANVWVANSLSNTVTKLRASDGKVLGNFKTGGESPWFLAFDGKNIWVTNEGNEILSELSAADGSVIATYPQKHGVAGIAFDGTYIWVSDFYSAVYRYKLDGKEAGTFQLGYHHPFSMAFDGGNMWVVNDGNGTVSKLRASDGKVLGTFTVGNAGPAYGIAYDGQSIWISGESAVVEMRPSDGKLLFQQHLLCCVGAVGFDGANIWVAGGSGRNVAYKM